MELTATKKQGEYAGISVIKQILSAIETTMPEPKPAAESLSKHVEQIAKLAETKRIYSAIEAILTESSPACLAFTSASPGEGKTLLTAGLGIISANRNAKRVLVLDLNWRAPALHRCFGLEPAFDVRRIKAQDVLTNLVRSSGVGHLDVCAAPQWSGDFNGSTPDLTLLGVEILRRARESYDLVLVDTSSVFPVDYHTMDPVTLSRFVDGVVLVVLANVTPRQDVKRAYMRLVGSGAKIFGIVVNQWKNSVL